jgi:hypothetical protein
MILLRSLNWIGSRIQVLQNLLGWLIVMRIFDFCDLSNII